MSKDSNEKIDELLHKIQSSRAKFRAQVVNPASDRILERINSRTRILDRINLGNGGGRTASKKEESEDPLDIIVGEVGKLSNDQVDDLMSALKRKKERANSESSTFSARLG